MAVASGTPATFSVRPTAPGRRTCACAAAKAKWWAPLLGWSGKPDYIDAKPSAAPAPATEPADAAAGARRFGVLTEEKARQLRMRMMETQSFHDAMYHSAIASRLASAAPGTSGAMP
ncbi:unnamed protein product [Alopecurus aequalis]